MGTESLSKRKHLLKAKSIDFLAMTLQTIYQINIVLIKIESKTISCEKAAFFYLQASFFKVYFKQDKKGYYCATVFSQGTNIPSLKTPFSFSRAILSIRKRSTEASITF